MRSRWLPLCAALLACSSSPESETDDSRAAYSSASGNYYRVSFQGEVATDGFASGREAVLWQMRYTVGMFKAHGGSARLDDADPKTLGTRKVGSTTLVKYEVDLGLSMAKATALGESITIRLPVRVAPQARSKFYEKYGRACIAHDAHDVDAESYWFDYEPDREGCSLSQEDVFTANAKVSLSDKNTHDKFPRYDKLWEDGALRFLAVFGKDDPSGGDLDVGVQGFRIFLADAYKALNKPKVLPASVSVRPVGDPDGSGYVEISGGNENPDIELEGMLPTGKRVIVHAILIDSINDSGAVSKFEARSGKSFTKRMDELFPTADVLLYNGHSGLGGNVQRFVRLGHFKPGQYQIFYFSGCASFAYMDQTLPKRRREVNPSDPRGTEFMEIISNSVPPQWFSMAQNTSVLLRSLVAEPAMNYEQILGKMNQSGIPNVTGEEDNTYVPPAR